MRSNPFLFTLIFSVILFAIDFTAYKGIKNILVNSSTLIKRLVFNLFWIVPVFIIGGIIYIWSFSDEISPARLMPYFHFISGAFILFYVPKLIFILFYFADNLLHLLSKVFIGRKLPEDENGNQISRRRFLTRAGIVIAGIPFLSIAYGIKWGRFNFAVRKHTLSFNNLPREFDGLKIIQISDFHIGSFIGNEPMVDEIVYLVNNQNPDMILFTGDLVNNVADELNPFVDSLKKLNAKYGKYSVLGNHDYGEYVRWNSEIEKQNNLYRLIDLQKEIGFDLLTNDSRSFSINGSSINIIGVENWGLPPFPQYGDLKKAMQKVKNDNFKILLSHDPTHWDKHVLNYTNIDLTLSGHTHGAQFGVEIPGWRWSPVNLRYKRWGGLYTEGRQKLNVNTGIGFIGFPGRVGMPPEVTVIELKTV